MLNECYMCYLSRDVGLVPKEHVYLKIKEALVSIGHETLIVLVRELCKPS